MKYKIGDKVKIKDNSYNGFFYAGETVEITELFPEEPTTHYGCTNGVKSWYVSDRDLEEPQTFITKPIDYTGCHPDIASALKRGESILCRVRDSEDSNWREKPEYIIGFSSRYPYPYFAKEGCNFKYAEPITKPKTITKVKKASEIVKWLEDNGYEVDSDGSWLLPRKVVFTFSMFQYCGKEPDHFSVWLPEWLEEVEC